jgi:thymidylate synthase (FAD)
MTVELIDSMASDMRVIHAAQVSTKGAKAEASLMSEEGQIKFIDFLMDGRHGSPFEHSVFTFLVTAPIFVWREFMRHRIASYNEESSRYKQLDPVFYIPAQDRNLKQVGKPGQYDFVPGDPDDYEMMKRGHEVIAGASYQMYERMLDFGIAREVARMTLPVNIYSSAYVTMNARSLMNFLSLRTKREATAYPSFPQREIEMVAEQMEQHFEELMPHTIRAFNARGRVAP